MHNTVLKFCKDVECEWVYNQDSDVISIHYDVLEVRRNHSKVYVTGVLVQFKSLHGSLNIILGAGGVQLLNNSSLCGYQH